MYYLLVRRNFSIIVFCVEKGESQTKFSESLHLIHTHRYTENWHFNKPKQADENILHTQ